MKNLLVGTLAALMFGTLAFGEAKYPLNMTAVYTKGHLGRASADANFHSGEYACTAGDANNAPTCLTAEQWAGLDQSEGTPNTVVFTMADGTVVKVQSPTDNELPGYLACESKTRDVFCDLYSDLFDVANALPPTTEMEMVNGHRQEVSRPPQEFVKEMEDHTKNLFGNGNSFKVIIPYRLKGKVNKNTGAQGIDVSVSQFPPTPGYRDFPGPTPSRYFPSQH